jgi:hypothetical protein
VERRRQEVQRQAPKTREIPLFQKDGQESRVIAFEGLETNEQGRREIDFLVEKGVPEPSSITLIGRINEQGQQEIGLTVFWEGEVTPEMHVLARDKRDEVPEEIKLAVERHDREPWVIVFLVHANEQDPWDVTLTLEKTVR